MGSSVKKKNQCYEKYLLQYKLLVVLARSLYVQIAKTLNKTKFNQYFKKNSPPNFDFGDYTKVIITYIAAE